MTSTKVGVGANAGVVPAKPREPERAQEPTAGSLLAQATIMPETYNGRPVGALEAEVLRDMERDAYRQQHGPPVKNYTPEELARVFDPPVTPYANPLRELTADQSARVDAIAAAPDLETALRLLHALPEVFHVSETGSATIFELRLTRHQPDDIPNDHKRTYATSLNLVAHRGVLSTLRLQAVQHDAVRSNNVLRRDADVVGFDHAIDTDFLTKMLSSHPVSTQQLVSELRGTLTPAVLGDAVRKLLVSGRPTRIEQPFVG